MPKNIDSRRSRTSFAPIFAALFLIAALTSISAAWLFPHPSTQSPDLKALDGDWIYVEDRTDGRTLEQMSPPMNSKFTFRVVEGAVILVWGHGGGGNRDVRVALDGSITEIPGTNPGSLTRYRGSWKDGVFTYEIDFVRGAGQEPTGLIRRDFRMTPDGLQVRFMSQAEPPSYWVGIYRHPQDIPMPTPAKATIGDMKWLAGAWTGTRGTGGTTTMEERWSPPLGGSMLAVSRTVSRDKLSAFEYLRIVEREGGLVYVAQPNGSAPTEFVLTELSGQRAVFENPRHDFPKRIVYELSAEGGLTASIGYTKGGTPRRFEFKREGG